jgi:hypothetical protein
MKRPAGLLAIGSLILVIIAAGYLLVAPCFYKGVKATSQTDGTKLVETSCSSLVEREGLSVIPVIAIPVVLIAAATLSLRFGQPAGVWVCTLLALAFAALAIFSVGLFFLPAVLLMLFSAALVSVHRSRTTVRTESQTT